MKLQYFSQWIVSFVMSYWRYSRLCCKNSIKAWSYSMLINDLEICRDCFGRVVWIFLNRQIVLSIIFMIDWRWYSKLTGESNVILRCLSVLYKLTGGVIEIYNWMGRQKFYPNKYYFLSVFIWIFINFIFHRSTHSLVFSRVWWFAEMVMSVTT